MKSKRTPMKTPIFLSLAVTLVVSVIVSCGGKDEANPNPAPAPAPTTPVPPTNPPPPTPNNIPIPPPSGSLVPGTNCPSIAGDRNLHQDGSPFLGQLQGSNTLTFSIYFSRYSSYDTFGQNVVGAGQFSFPDIYYFTGMQIPTQNYNICLSSLGLNNTPATPGVFNLQDLSVAMSVRGYVDVPLYSPYGSYPGSYYAPGSTTPTMGKEIVEMSIGNGWDCRAYLYQGRIYGCIEVRMGRQNPFRMQSR